MGGSINWQFSTLGSFFTTFYQWMIGGPILFVMICICAWGVVKLVTTEGRSGWVQFVGAPIAVLIVYGLQFVFPGLGAATV